MCNLVAQGPRDAEGGVQAGSREGTDGTGDGTHEIIYFKLYKSQIPVIEQALETAALMLGTDKSRGYCLEMICADFLAGANLDSGNPQILLRSIRQFLKFLPSEQQETLVSEVSKRIS